MLTAYYLDPSTASPTIDTTSVIWKVNNTGPDVALGQMLSTNNLFIQQNTSNPEQVTIGQNVTAGSVSFDSKGPYTLVFPPGTSYNVAAASMSVVSSGAPSSFYVDVELTATGQINSGLSAANSAVTISGQGPLTFGGSGTVTVASIINLQAPLTINNTVEITDARGSQNGLYLGDPATLAGTGNILLDTANTPLQYLSGQNSTFAGNIQGAGALIVNQSSANLTLTGGDNTYAGGTKVLDGTLNLGNGATLGAPTSTLEVDAYCTLNLNGSAITVDNVTGAGTISNSIGGSPATFTVAAASGDTFSGSIYNNIRLVMEGAGTLSLAGANSYTGGTEVDRGWLVVAGGTAFPNYTALSVNAPGKFDADGNNLTFSSLSGRGSSAYSPDADATITNSAAAPVLLTIGEDTQNSPDSAFGGRIVDGAGPIGVDLDNCGVTLTNLNNNYSQGTSLTDAALFLGDGVNNGLVTGLIKSDDTDRVYFNVAAKTTVTFLGTLQENSDNSYYVYKTGPGTLTMSPSESPTYGTLSILGGAFIQGNAQALPDGIVVTVDNGATFNLGGLETPLLPVVHLTNGTISNGTLNVAGVIDAQHGEIDAALAGTAAFQKNLSQSPFPMSNVPGDTVIVNSPADSRSPAGGVITDQIYEGGLIINGVLGRPIVGGAVGAKLVVGAGAPGVFGSLSGYGTYIGPVTVQLGGTLALGSPAGGTLTLGGLTLQSGSTVTDNVQAAAMVLAEIAGQLTINNGAVVDLVEQGGDVLAVYQELFQYNAITAGSFNNLTIATPLPSGVSMPTVVNNVPNASIDLAFGTPLFWTNGSGAWSAATSNWSATPDGSSPARWTDNDVAVIEPTAGTSTITLEDSATKQPAAIVFLSDGYTIADSGGANPGFLTIAQSRVLTDRYWTGTIAARVTCPTTLVTSGAGTTTLTNRENLSAGLAVREGTTLIAFPIVLADGANLYVGGNAMSGFAAQGLSGGQMPAGAANLSSGGVVSTGGSSLPAGGKRTDVSAAEAANAEAIVAARVAARAVAETAVEAAQAAAAAHARAALALMQRRLAAGRALIADLEEVIDPGSAVHSRDVELAACKKMFDILVAAIKMNGGTRDGLTNDIWSAAANQVLGELAAAQAATASGLAGSDSPATSGAIAGAAAVDAALLDWVAAVDAKTAC